ncbi:MAG TPA: tripartite tricarboxylate transporter substrate-binding protein [Propylenella sp.]|nr:tripartite tricarboxylate transporter substrate-binding protein [Propylenella sp.]
MMKSKNLRLVSCAAAALFLIAPAAAQDDKFFEGEKLTYVITTDPGGGYDTYGRLVAKYMEKHLPGSQVIVQNIPGAGHIVGTNTLYAAEPDGLTIGSFNTGLINSQLLGREGIQFNLAEMSWIGKAATDTRSLVVSKDCPYQSIDEMRAAPEPVKMAAAGVGSAAYIDTILIAEALDLDFEVIPGFDGNEGEMSMMRGEVCAQIGSTSSLEPFVENGHGKFILQVGGTSEAGVPQARDLAKDERGKSIVALIDALSEISRLTAGPPGIPEDRLQILRDAYMAALTDPELLAEAEKLDIPIEPASGAEVEERVKAALAQPPETVALLKEATKE